MLFDDFTTDSVPCYCDRVIVPEFPEEDTANKYLTRMLSRKSRKGRWIDRDASLCILSVTSNDDGYKKWIHLIKNHKQFLYMAKAKSLHGNYYCYFILMRTL